MHRTETVESNALASVPMNSVWRTIRSYIFWSHERGTIQYDVMVTLILLFVFLTPFWINFKDKPVERNPHPTDVAVVSGDGGELIYEIQASAITLKAQGSEQDQLLQIIEPISGAVTITKIEKERDKSGHVLNYKVWAER